MPIAFHPDAEKRFDERADALRKELKLVDAAGRQAVPGYVPSLAPAGTITEDNIKDFRHLGDFNSITGEMVRLQFANEHQTYELGAPACAELNDLTESVWRAQRRRVSLERIVDEASKWLDPSTVDKRNFCCRLVEEISPSLKSAIHWVPIANLHVQSPLEFADVVFREISSKHFDEWTTKSQIANPSDVSKLGEHFQRRREKYQGFAAATIEIDAEPSYGPKVAIEAATKAVTLLRTFCPENFNVQSCSFTLPYGRTFIPHDDVWTQDADGVVPSTQVKADIPPPMAWTIHDAILPELHKAGLGELSRIARAEEPTRFEQKLLDALHIYNRANVSAHSGDKIFYTVVALEMILLKNDNENIQLAIGDRLAFIFGRGIEERLKIVGLIKDIYQLRSRWVHHGQTPQGNALQINNFLRLSWSFFTYLVRNEGKCSSPEAFLEHLDNFKYR